MLAAGRRMPAVVSICSAQALLIMLLCMELQRTNTQPPTCGQRGAVARRDAEADGGALAAPNPVALHLLDGVRPVQAVQVAEQPARQVGRRVTCCASRCCLALWQLPTAAISCGSVSSSGLLLHTAVAYCCTPYLSP